MTPRIVVWVAAAASALMCGCFGAGGGNVLDGDCHVSWLDDGKKTSATTGNAVWASKEGRDSIDMNGVNHSAGIEIYTAMPTPFTAQTFVCGQMAPDQALLLTYRNDNPAGPAIQTESCSVSFTQVGAIGGAPIIGTFEVVFDLPNGGTKTITNGTFQIPLSK